MLFNFLTFRFLFITSKKDRPHNKQAGEWGGENKNKNKTNGAMQEALSQNDFYCPV